MIDLSFKHRFQLVSEGVVGPLNRQINPDGFHPMLRQNWSIDDALRGALAYYCFRDCKYTRDPRVSSCRADVS
jgi:hypothetical protein